MALSTCSKPAAGARGLSKLHLTPVFRPSFARRAVWVSAIFGSAKKSPKQTAAKRETIIPDPSPNIPITLLALSGFSYYEGVNSAAVLFGILGLFLSIQATRVRFVFDDEGLEVLTKSKETTENAFVGGRNRWSYDSFVNWEFWWPNFPVLVYFKETQTKPEGQIHFFPIIFNGKQLYNVMAERCGSSVTSLPKK